MARCIYCGVPEKKGLTECPRCKRPYKKMVDFSAFNFNRLSDEDAEAVIAAMSDYKREKSAELIRSEGLFLAEAYYDNYIRYSSSTAPGGYEYYMQIKTPEGNPCNTEIRIFEGGMDMNKVRDLKVKKLYLLKLQKKKKTLYFIGDAEDDMPMPEKLAGMLENLDVYYKKRYTAGLSAMLLHIMPDTRV